MSRYILTLIFFFMPIFIIPVFADQIEQPPTPPPTYQSKKQELEDMEKALKKITDIFWLCHDDCYNQPSWNEFTDNFLHGGLSRAIDPYSRYLDKKQTEKNSIEYDGKFGGIGLNFGAVKDPETKELKQIIFSVFKDTPGQKAGIKKDDLIIAVSSSSHQSDKVFTQNLSLDETGDLIRGDPGTKVTLWILRGEEIKEFKMVREIIFIPSVEFEKVTDKIGYLKITEFIETTEKDFELAVDSMVASGMKSLIIDVRNNPGGLLDIVVSITNRFKTNPYLPSVYVAGRDRLPEVYVAEKELYSNRYLHNPYKNLKVAVLINHESASASEILAGWFKEDFGAQIIGEKSFGKGSVQLRFSLDDGSRVYLTKQHYFVGHKRYEVHGKGIIPTIEVKNPESNMDMSELKDSVTGELYCVAISSGAVQKEKNKCEESSMMLSLKDAWEQEAEKNDLQLKKAVEVAEELLKEK